MNLTNGKAVCCKSVDCWALQGHRWVERSRLAAGMLSWRYSAPFTPGTECLALYIIAAVRTANVHSAPFPCWHCIQRFICTPDLIQTTVLSGVCSYSPHFTDEESTLRPKVTNLVSGGAGARAKHSRGATASNPHQEG